MRIVEFNKTHTRTYATRKGAVEAAENVQALLPEEVHHLIIVLINTDGTRFSPAFVLRAEAVQFGLSIAQRGFFVTN